MKRVAEAARKDVGSLKKQAAEMVKMKLLKAMVTKQLELEHLSCVVLDTNLFLLASCCNPLDLLWGCICLFLAYLVLCSMTLYVHVDHAFDSVLHLSPGPSYTLDMSQTSL